MAKKQESNEKIMSLADKLSKIRQQINKVNASAGKVVAGFISDPEIADSLTVKFLPTPNDDLNEAIGGGFPIILEGTGVIGCVACSGLFHEDDHQVLVDAISGMLGIDLDA